MSPLIIGVDFDGTIVEHQYPEIGPPVDGAIECLKECVDRGARLVLWTMRSGEGLDQAVAWLKEQGVTLWGVNANPETNWTTSPKAYCHVYVDDAALGCPLQPSKTTKRPCADWEAISSQLLKLVTDRQNEW